jgi:PKD repeat protein
MMSMKGCWRLIDIIADRDANDMLREASCWPMYISTAEKDLQASLSITFYTERDGNCDAIETAPTSGEVATKLALYGDLESYVEPYSYTMDEPGATCRDDAELQAAMDDWHTALAASSVKSMITMPYHADWTDKLDIMCVLMKFHDQDDLDTWLALNLDGWVYQTLLQDQDSPKWLMDFSLLNFRVHGFMMRVMGYTGALYWACDDWTADPWNDVELAKWGGYKPGEGMILYPSDSTPEGDLSATYGSVCPSMRLWQFRDAAVDYEYAKMAYDEGLTSEVAAILATIGTDWDWGNWTTDKEVIKQAHYDLWVLLDDEPTPPTAEFSADVTSGTAPLTVTFTDASTDSPTSWAWDFGDTGSSSDQNPEHEYAAAGTYTVTLTATNADGSDDEVKVAYITVSDAPSPPEAAFSGTPLTGIAPYTVTFTNSSVNDVSWAWTFGDSGSSALENPTHEYTVAGIYTVKLTVTSAGADTDEEEKVDYIEVLAAGLVPSAAFDAEPLSGSRSLRVDFTDLSTQSPTSWSWDFGDGQSSTDQNPTHYYRRAGTYTVALTATNANGSDTETKTDYIVVSKKPRRKDRGGIVTWSRRHEQ